MNPLQLWKLYRFYKKEVEPMFDGYKTYLCALGIGVAAAAYALGVIDETTYKALLGALGGGGLAALRAGVAKS